MSVRSTLLAGLALLLPAGLAAQTTPVEGLRSNPPGVHALTGARIVVAPGRVIERGTLVIRNGVIEAVGANVAAPADARVWDLAGRTLYAGFIDPYSSVGMRDTMARNDPERDRGAVYWNPQVRAHVDAVNELAPDAARLARLRSHGFATANVVPQLGLFRGQTAVVSLGDEDAALRVVRRGIAQSVTMGRDNQVGTGYPTSAMGGIAFVRQTLHDADWHMKAHAAYERNPRGVRRPEYNVALAALAPALRKEQPLLFEATNEEEVLRALKFRDEFPVNLWIRASGAEYRIADKLTGLNAPLIVPVNYPAAPNVQTPERALDVSLMELRHWHLAPENPKHLAAARVDFAFTADGLGQRASFVENVRTAVHRGLARDAALAAMTTTPARYLGIERTHGTLEQGKVANVVVASGDIFTDGSTIQDVWVDGRRFPVASDPATDPRGQWRIIASAPMNMQATLTLSGTRQQLSGNITSQGGTDVRVTSARITGEAPQLQLTLPATAMGQEGLIRLSASASATNLAGWGEMPDGTRFNWTAERTGEVTQAGTSPNGEPRPRPAALALPVVRPSMEFGRPAIPEQPAAVLVRNATVWTMGPEGKLEGADLLVTRGRVTRVGRNLQAPAGAVVVDATGKHVTPGLIDAHLHSGVSGGVNETGSAIVPEVRIGDILTMNNIWMYRQLAGGLTAAHVMHGSANPIGGQNQHVKMRWGALPDELKIDGAPRTVKFALGENVKRRTGRYPDTRMGTEQIIRDHFLAAREYEARWAAWRRNPQGIPPRKDLRMDALVDILNGDILVQSHSYRQDEILMLMRLAEEFDFRIKAFHHTVEAFKLGPELKAHGAGAVIWSDWGAFKIEAYDNTTYNARVLRDAGVLTSLHSDNSQIAARMNWEAAKMLRTGLTPEEALALVTINTAKILGVDNRIGSLEPNKDADFVIWSGDPLSTESRPEQTWVDGRKYFDLNEDRQLRQRTERERSQLIQLILSQR